jgi:RNA polymerase sigma factor (sigma-70 family)
MESMSLLRKYATTKNEREKRRLEDRILRINMGLVSKQCEKISRSYPLVEWDDMFQLGCIGLLKSIRKFNPDTGNALSSYAVPMIKWEIFRTLQRQKAIKFPRDYVESFPHIRKLREDAGKTFDEIALIMSEKRNKDYSKSEIYDIYYALKQSDPVSLDQIEGSQEFISDDFSLSP